MKETWYAHGSNKKGSPWEPIQDHVLSVRTQSLVIFNNKYTKGQKV